MKLKTITFKQTPRLPGLRADAVTSIDLDNVPSALAGWNILVRGPVLVLVSPPGWTKQTATSPTQRDSKGPMEVHVIPTSDAYLHWIVNTTEELDTIAKGGVKHETGPIGIKPVAVDATKAILAQIPAGQVGDA